MKVVILCGGRFFAFDWARGFLDRGELSAMVTTYPRAYRERLPKDMLLWNRVIGIAERLLRKVPFLPPTEIDYACAKAFGRWAAPRLPEGDVLQAWTGYALESLQVANERGMLTVAHRASAHIEAQVELVEREFVDFGRRVTVTSPRMIAREREEYDRAQYIQVISTFALNTFLERGVARERLILVPPPFDVREVGNVERVARTDGPLRVLHLGHVSLRKGVRYLLEAARRLGRDAVSVSLVGGLAEEGKEILERFAMPGEYRGPANREQLRHLFATHDVVAVPSVEDGGPAVVGEAMGAGLPVIASTNTVGPDLIEEGVSGFIVRPRDVDQLADRLEVLRADPARCRAMGEAAARSGMSGVTVPRLVERMSAEYHAALARRGVRRPFAAPVGAANAR